ncbi:hypothetical protein [Natronorubrum aibiense]|uniref:Rubrerythrin-like domain-containing protein n=1 Tax=Natronorubrum aibiense TaxID=348826 RepID=A0A5P9P714_9EURY|nr:hypothetical protein [Natronorubrum aibiense]QFU83933.1 hypothetical protein GCU68_16000 [Natronorubrum aibiense]
MATRTDGKSNSPLARLRARIRSTLFAGDEPTADDTSVESPDPTEQTAAPDAPGNLFQCATCGTVYIDTEKQTCSHCEDAVEEVRSTLRSSVGRP